ncbi:MAG TPA: ABC transporter permease [Fusibacter sp.]|nr:ABC transporter permease [Fusibacter sp.]
MMKKIIVKVIFAAIIILSVTFIAYFLADQHPNNAQVRWLDITQAEKEVQKELLGLNAPVHERYFKWFTSAVSGDLGTYYTDKKPVNYLLFMYMADSFLLNAVAFVVAISIALPMGVLAATKERKWRDHIIMVLTMVLTSVPSFYFGLLTILWVARKMPGFLPISGMGDVRLIARGYPSLWSQITDIAHHMVLPVASISLVWIGTLVPYIRNAMLEVIHQDYIRTAKAKGLAPYNIFFKHTLRNALLPLISLMAMLIPTLIMSNIFVEEIFSWPGIGMLFIESIRYGETDMMVAIVLCYAIMVILGNLIADGLYAKADARLKGGAL